MRLLLRLISHIPRPVRKYILVSVDAVLVAVAFWASFAIRLDAWWPEALVEFLWLVPFVVAMSLVALSALRLYNTLVRYAGAYVLLVITMGLFVTAAVFYGLMQGYAVHQPPRSVWMIFPLMATGLLGGCRVAFRELISLQRRTGSHKRVVIYGAGEAGTQLARALRADSVHRPIAFLDDDPALRGCTINGLPVYDGVHARSLIDSENIDAVLLAMPSVPRSVRAKIIERLQSFDVQVLVIPGLVELASGRCRVEDVRRVDIEDVLGRDVVPPDRTLLEARITGSSVMVTGAGGSIGSELCRQIVHFQPERLVLLEQSEYALYAIDKELRRANLSVRIVSVLGDVQDEHHVRQVLSEHGVETIYHAAAYKHVPLVEDNPIDGVRNNVFGTLQAAQAAIDAGVERFVLISTDKAVRPTNVMGASKRMAELALQGLSQVEHDICFTMVRFGNVLGSSGSVVPLFKQQIRDGGPVTVTHPEVTRYFMTIPEAVSLVLQASSMARGGEVFLLDMGRPVKIVDLAKTLIQLSGLQVQDEEHPDGDIAIEYVGLRPGEKLYEELLLSEADRPTDHPLIRKAYERSAPWAVTSQRLQQLAQALAIRDEDAVRRILEATVDGYSPQESRQRVHVG